MPASAIVLTDNSYTSADCKAAHGLVRGSERFLRVLAVLDSSVAGAGAGELLLPVLRDYLDGERARRAS